MNIGDYITVYDCEPIEEMASEMQVVSINNDGTPIVKDDDGQTYTTEVDDDGNIYYQPNFLK